MSYLGEDTSSTPKTKYSSYWVWRRWAAESKLDLKDPSPLGSLNSRHHLAAAVVPLIHPCRTWHLHAVSELLNHKGRSINNHEDDDDECSRFFFYIYKLNYKQMRQTATAVRLRCTCGRVPSNKTLNKWCWGHSAAIFYITCAVCTFDLSVFDTWQDNCSAQESDSRCWAETDAAVWIK